MGLAVEPVLYGASYYVVPSGADTNSGNMVAPFKTLAKAAAIAMPGDTVYLRQGVYRETLTLQRSGTAGSPIRFQGYSGENAIIAGSNLVSGSWSLSSGKIWMIDGLPATNDVFVDGIEMPEARWPNVAPGVSMTAGWAIADSGSNATTLVDAALPAGNLNGARVRIIPGAAWVAYTRGITNYGAGQFNFDASVGGSASYYPTAGNQYYLYRSLALLDAAGEWYQDPGTHRLYLWTPDGLAPSTHVIEIASRAKAVNAGAYSYIELSNLYTFAGGVSFAGGSNCKVTALRQKYVHHESEVDGYNFPGTPNEFNGGSNNVWSGGEIDGSSGDGIFIGGSNNTVSNMLIHNVCEIGTYRGAVRMAGSNHQVTGNSFYDSGRFLIFHGGVKGGALTHNHLYNAGLLTRDLGATYCYRTDGGGMVIAYNHVHNTDCPVGAGIYLDNGSGNFVIHHNVVHDCSYFALKLNLPSNNNLVVNNTLYGPKYAINGTANSGNPTASMTGTTLVNNLYSGTLKLVTGSAAPVLIANASYTAPPAIFATGSWQLAAGSPAIDKGVVQSPYTDGYCAAAPDQGAYEYNCGTAWNAGCSVVSLPFPYPDFSIPPTATLSPTRSATRTPSRTATATPTRTATAAFSATPTPTSSRTPTPILSATFTPSATQSSTPALSGTATPSSTRSATPLQSQTATPSSSPSATSSGTVSASPTLTFSLTPQQSPTFTPSATPSPTRTSSPTPSVSSTVSPTPTRTSTATLTLTPVNTPGLTQSPTPTRSATQTRTPVSTPSQSPSATPQSSATATSAVTPTAAPTQAAGADEDARLIEAWPMPNPNPAWLWVTVKGKPGDLHLELFSSAFQKIDDRHMLLDADNGHGRLDLPEAWRALSCGLYYIRVSLGKKPGEALILKILRIH